MNKYLVGLFFFSVLFTVSCKKTMDVNSPDSLAMDSVKVSTTITGKFVPNELLIKFKTSTSPKSRTRLLSSINGNVIEHIVTKAMELSGDNNGIYLVNTETDVFSAIARMKGESDIEYAEPNWIYTHAESNDPYYVGTHLWGMYGDDLPTAVGAPGTYDPFGCQAEKAWAAGHTGSRSIVVGVIDEGIQFDHPDLAANIWTNPYEIPKNKKDDDGNGYVDDVHGWDFANNDNTIYDGGSRATADKHGTHVSGTIGGIGGNSIGVAGVNWAVTIISAKFLGRNGGTTANAIKAVDYLTTLKTMHPGLDIVASNNSWGGGGFSNLLLQAIARGANKNILFIAAAGNNGSNNDVVANYPSNYKTNGITVSNGTCNYDAVIAVAALQSDGLLASYSNYGANTVDLGGPGTWIYSTVPPNTYAAYSGTSMATPHVTGAAALYAATHSERGSALKQVLLTSAVNTPTASLTNNTTTKGRINVTGF